MFNKINRIMEKKNNKNCFVKRAIALVAALSLVVSSSVVYSERVSASSTTTSDYTGSTYTHQDKFDGMNIYNGIDVSYYQKTINWKDVKADGIDYAFIRLGYRGSAGGTLNMDTCYETNMANAHAAGVKTGVYFFTQAITEEEAVEEANYCIEHLQGYTVDMPVAIDFESVGGGGRMYNANLSTEEYTAIVTAFCEQIKVAGYTPAIYASASVFSGKLDGDELTAKYKIWLAHYTTSTSFAYPFSFWQYSSKGSIDGITGNVDCNFFYSSTDLSEAVSAVVTTSTQSAVSVEGGSVSLSGSKTYTGGEICPTTTVKVSGKNLTLNTDYVVGYSNNINPGIATVTITGIGKYTGTTSKTFKIKPAKLAKFKAKASENGVYLNWGKLSGSQGFEIYRKETFDGEYQLLSTIVNGTVYEYEDTSAKSGQEYYYKIRGYADVEGAKVYGKANKVTGSDVEKSTKCMTIRYTNIRKKPHKGKTLLKVAANTKLKYRGLVTRIDGSKAYHVIYKKKGKMVEGYIAREDGLKIL